MTYKVPNLNALQFVDRIVVSGNVTTRTFGAGGNGQFGTALNGDLDTTYVLEANVIKTNGSNTVINVNPNAITTNQLGNTLEVTNAGVVSAVVDSRWHLCRGFTTAVLYSSVAIIQARSGKQRYFTARTGIKVSAGNQQSAIVNKWWNDTATVITSLEISSTVASGILNGSIFTLWKRPSPA